VIPPAKSCGSAYRNATITTTMAGSSGNLGVSLTATGGGGGIGHDGGIISYAVNGKQYIALTAGWGGMATDDYPAAFGEPFTSMPKDTGALIVYALK